MKTLLIFNYHQLIYDKNKNDITESNPYNVRKSQFISHINLIKKKDIPITSISDWKENKFKHKLSIALTFDDGYKSDFEIAYPILKSEGFVASFFPIISKINTENRLSWTEIKELSENGFYIGSHGLTHTNLLELDQNNKYNEIVKSKETIETKLNGIVDTISLPYGMYNNALLKKIKNADYKTALTTRAKPNYNTANILLHRVNIKENTSLIEFEKIISLNKNSLLKKNISSSISFSAIQLMGTSIANSISSKF